MSKLVLGCCLLLAAASAGCQAQPVVPNGVNANMGAQMQEHDHVQVASAAAAAWDWDVDDVVVEPIAGAGGCGLLAVRSPNTLPSLTRTVAVVEGEVLLPGSDGALERVLAACGAEAGALAWAEAVAAFGDGVPQGYVVRQEQEISSLAHRMAMDAGGYAFHPPRFSGDGAGDRRAVEFFLTDVEAVGLYQIRADRGADGVVQVSASPAGGP